MTAPQTPDSPDWEPNTPFVAALLDQLRAQNTYGSLDTRSWQTLLHGFLPVIAPNWAAKRPPAGLAASVPRSMAGPHRAECFFSTVAREVAARTGRDASAIVVLGQEGMGRAMVLVGRLIAAHAYLRDIEHFGFFSLEHLENQGQSYIAEACESVTSWPEIAKQRV